MRKKNVVIAGLLLAIFMLVLPVSTVSAQPILQISNITKQFGSVKATINNVGSADATNVQWSFTFTGGWILMPSGSITTGTLTVLAPAASSIITTRAFGIAGVCGIPTVTITISVSCTQAPTVTATAPWHHLFLGLIWI